MNKLQADTLAVADGQRWRAACNNIGVRIQSHFSTSTPPATQAAQSGSSPTVFQVVLAFMSEKGLSLKGAAESSAAMHEGVSAADHKAGSADGAQTHSGSSFSVIATSSRASITTAANEKEIAKEKAPATLETSLPHSKPVASTGSQKSERAQTTLNGLAAKLAIHLPAPIMALPAKHLATQSILAPQANAERVSEPSVAGDQILGIAAQTVSTNHACANAEGDVTPVAASPAITPLASSVSVSIAGQTDLRAIESTDSSDPRATSIKDVANGNESAVQLGASSTPQAAPGTQERAGVQLSEAFARAVSQRTESDPGPAKETTSNEASTQTPSASNGGSAQPAVQQSSGTSSVSAPPPPVGFSYTNLQVVSTTAPIAKISAISQVDAAATLSTSAMRESAAPSSVSVARPQQIDSRAAAEVAKTFAGSASTKETASAKAITAQASSESSDSISATAISIDAHSIDRTDNSQQEAIGAQATTQIPDSAPAPVPAKQVSPEATSAIAAQTHVAAATVSAAMPQAEIEAPPAAAIASQPVEQPIATPAQQTQTVSAAASQPAIKPAQKEAPNAAAQKNSSPADSTEQSAAKPAETTASAQHDAQQQGSSSDQNAPANRPQAAIAPQPQAVAIPVAADNSTAHHAVNLTALPSHSIETPELSAANHAESIEDAAPTGINVARLTQAMNSTEMRVGMRSIEFGDISIRTSVSQQQLTAQISLDHSGLSQALSAHVASMQTKLGEDYGLHTSIQINHQASAFSGGSEQSSSREQRPFASSGRTESAGSLAEVESNLHPATLAVAGDGHRLDIRA